MPIQSPASISRLTPSDFNSFLNAFVGRADMYIDMDEQKDRVDARGTLNTLRKISKEATDYIDSVTKNAGRELVPGVFGSTVPYDKRGTAVAMFYRNLNHPQKRDMRSMFDVMPSTGPYALHTMLDRQEYPNWNGRITMPKVAQNITCGELSGTSFVVTLHADNPDENKDIGFYAFSDRANSTQHSSQSYVSQSVIAIGDLNIGAGVPFVGLAFINIQGYRGDSRIDDDYLLSVAGHVLPEDLSFSTGFLLDGSTGIKRNSYSKYTDATFTESGKIVPNSTGSFEHKSHQEIITRYQNVTFGLEGRMIEESVDNKTIIYPNLYTETYTKVTLRRKTGAFNYSNQMVPESTGDKTVTYPNGTVEKFEGLIFSGDDHLVQPGTRTQLTCFNVNGSISNAKHTVQFGEDNSYWTVD